eukprot:1669596-Pyramimonas_sp.AAC.1
MKENELLIRVVAHVEVASMDRQPGQLVLSCPIKIPHPSLTDRRPSSQVDAVLVVVDDPDRVAIA